jgi:AraC family L-rhamnose operon regulatory protein RhaS
MTSLLDSGHWKSSKAGKPLPPHTNPGLELVYVASGAVRWDYDSREVHVPAHHLSFTWPWQIHGARNIRLPSVELYWILIPLVDKPPRDATPRMPSGLGLGPAESRRLIQLLRQSPPVIAVGRRAGRHIAQLVGELHANGNRLDLIARGYLLLLLGEVVMALEQKVNHARNLEQDAGLSAVRHFWEVELGGQIEQPWTLDGMAYACGLGRTAFATKTKELYADSPMRKLVRVRIESAAALLQEKKLSVTEIALRCGFTSSQHFATAFKDYRGHPPSAERKRAPRCFQ